MPFIGKESQIGSYSMLDALTASATASYSLTLDSVAFVPETANHLLVSLNGVIQKAGSSYTVSGSTLTFSSALTSSDSIDFILALGNVLDIGTPSDATVTNAKTNFVSTSSGAGLQIKGDGTTDGTLQLNCSQNSHGIKLKSPAHSAGASYTLTFPTTDGNANEFLQTDGSGVLTWATAGGDNSPAFSATMSSGRMNNVAEDTYHKIQFNTEVLDTDGCYDNSSNYRFTPTTAGKYLVTLSNSIEKVGSASAMIYAYSQIHKNGSVIHTTYSDSSSNHGYAIQGTVSAVIDMNGSSDYLEAYAYANTSDSANVNIIGGVFSNFYGIKVA